MSTFRRIGKHCVHCGDELEARPVASSRGFTIDGFEPMQYRHAGTQSMRCWPSTCAQPSTICGDYSRWTEAAEEA